MSTTLLNVLTSILSLKFRLNNLRWSHTWFCDCFSPVALRALSQIKCVPFSQKEIKMPDEDFVYVAFIGQVIVTISHYVPYNNISSIETCILVVFDAYQSK